MLSRELTLEVRSEPDPTSDVVYHYAAVATGIMSIDKPEDGYLPIESPRGKGWIDVERVTPATDLEYFMADERPVRLVEQLRDYLDAENDFSKLLSERGLIIAVGEDMVQIPRESAVAHHAVAVTGRATSAVASLQAEVLEAIRQALLDLADVSPDMAHSQRALIPTELWNFRYLAIRSPGHEAWLIHFEYVERRPYIVGISLDQ